MSEISILMAVYNGMPYLPEAVRSIRAQTFEDWTFVIIDDGSSDGTADYLDGLDDPRIRVTHQENQGLGAALNRGLELCDTEFLARMDSDDIAYPTRLQEQLDFSARIPKWACWARRFNDWANPASAEVRSCQTSTPRFTRT